MSVTRVLWPNLATQQLRPTWTKKDRVPKGGGKGNQGKGRKGRWSGTAKRNLSATFCNQLVLPHTVRDELVREHAFSDYSWGWQYDANCVTPLCESNTAKTSKTARGDNALWTRVNRIEMKRVAHGLSWPKWCKSSLHSLKVLKYVTVTVHRFGPCLIDLGWAWLVLQGLKSQAPLLI